MFADLRAPVLQTLGKGIVGPLRDGEPVHEVDLLAGRLHWRQHVGRKLLAAGEHVDLRRA